ncbi:hypothetical protein BC629DRAFT_120034 [Irpex lacteus]|nr:hypothetical protein BC629DRAFT_120034 [Irpex lacteus]
MSWSRVAFGNLFQRPLIAPRVTHARARKLSSYFNSNAWDNSPLGSASGSPRTHAAPLVNLDGLASQLRDALQEKGPEHVRSTFLKFFQDPTGYIVPASSSTASSIDTRQVIVSSLRKLAMANDVKFLERILTTLEKRGMAADDVTHTAILKGFHSRHFTSSALWWLQHISGRSAAYRPLVEWWNSHLSECFRLRRRELFWKSVDALRDAQVPCPNDETYRLIFRQLLAQHSPLSSRVIRLWITHMEEDNVRFTRSLFDSLVEEFTLAGASRSISSLEHVYLTSPHAEGKESLCAQLLATAIRTKGDASAHRLLLQFRQHGFTPTPATLDVIADVLPSAMAFRRWEDWLGVKASPTAWETLMARLSTDGHWRDVRSTYRDALRQGRQPTAGMLLPVLRVYCSKPSQPTDVDIREALELFSEYICLTSDDGRVGRTMPEAQDDLPLYNTLLRALTHSQSPSHHEVAVSLMKELRSRGIDIDHMATTSYIILLMKLSPSIQEAFQVYQMMRKRADGKYSLDQKGFVAVMNAYCNLRPNAGPALVTPYMTMLRDMRAAGYDVPPHVYTVVLRQLALFAAEVKKDNNGQLLGQLVDYIKHIHHTLTLDPTLNPDVALWNQLMDTYQRARCFNEAFTIWETMFASGRFDNITISIVLDACGFAGFVDKGRNIMKRVYKSGFSLNEHNWNTWVECLCRHKKFDEAMRVLSVEMPEKAGITTSVGIARLILRFAKGLPEEKGLHLRMKRELPELYAAVERSD